MFPPPRARFSPGARNTREDSGRNHRRPGVITAPLRTRASSWPSERRASTRAIGSRRRRRSLLRPRWRGLRRPFCETRRCFQNHWGVLLGAERAAASAICGARRRQRAGQPLLHFCTVLPAWLLLFSRKKAASYTSWIHLLSWFCFPVSSTDVGAFRAGVPTNFVLWVVVCSQRSGALLWFCFCFTMCCWRCSLR